MTFHLIHTAHAAGGGLDCTQLKPGESKVIHGFQGTSLHPKYTLVRTSASDYLALVNLEFRDEQGSANSKLQAQYEDLVQECYDLANTRLRGPKGETLGLGLSRRHPKIPQPETSPVKIVESMFVRSDSSKWNSAPDCPLILHETFHILGLVDTYMEEDLFNQVKEGTKTVSRTKYDCRYIATYDSVMTRQDEAFDAANLSWFSRKFKGQGRALLYAGEFYAITHPGCESLNSAYYECGKNAYHTSVGHGGKGCVQAPTQQCMQPHWIAKYGKLP